MALFRKSFRSPDHTPGKSDLPAHVPGVNKGEEYVIHSGREPGRQDEAPHRTARDSTSIDPTSRGPIDPRMPHIPPA